MGQSRFSKLCAAAALIVTPLTIVARGIEGQAINPAPWYLVGVAPESYQAFAWPFQVVGLRTYADW
jgi:hypothetical protein